MPYSLRNKTFACQLRLRTLTAVEPTSCDCLNAASNHGRHPCADARFHASAASARRVDEPIFTSLEAAGSLARGTHRVTRAARRNSCSGVWGTAPRVSRETCCLFLFSRPTKPRATRTPPINGNGHPDDCGMGEAMVRRTMLPPVLEPAME